MTAPVTAERMTVQVASILWAGETATAFSGTAPDGARMRVVGKGRDFEPVVGEVYRIEGAWHESERYGRQFYAPADGFRRLAPSGRLVVPWLQRIPGIGPERAKRIVRAFPGKLDRLFDGSVPLERLAEVIDPDRPNLAAQVAVAVALEWRDLKAEYATILWLEERGVEDVGLSTRVFRLFGAEAVAILERNPYVLAGVLPWKRVDAIGMAVLGGRDGEPDPANCARRIVGAIDAVMQAAVSEGETAVRKGTFRQLVTVRLGLERSDELDARIVEVGISNEAVLDGGDRWRSPGCAIMEEDVARRFRRMAAGEEGGGLVPPEGTDLRRILAMVELVERQREQYESMIKSIAEVLKEKRMDAGADY